MTIKQVMETLDAELLTPEAEPHPVRCTRPAAAT